MGVAKFVIVSLAIIALILMPTVRADFETQRAVDPFCYQTCSGSYSNTECLADCIAKKFKFGKCLTGQRSGKLPVCCCSP
ncbi:putative defensin-like protein 53 [Mercurialis annua]|uniref:putative defensin-like protein 53 n=1 Tax=Mercurialis annua TaxID=3986 RepID=UPI00216059FE|nr:putative defensin-like protein 53 [Mercurialis annua]